jgi:large subunit ribosomal protein L20
MALWSRPKVFRLAKGYYGRSKNCFRIAIRRVFKALQYEYISRRVRRREVRTNWIRSVNAGVRDQDINYSRFIYGLNRSNIMLDRKILAEIAKNEPYSFKAVVDEVKNYVPQNMLKKPEEITYFEAIEKKMLHFGPWQKSPPKDIEFRPISFHKKDQQDWYGVNRPDFPTFYKEEEKKHDQQMIPIKDQKKMRFTVWDDVPSDPEDD